MKWTGASYGWDPNVRTPRRRGNPPSTSGSAWARNEARSSPRWGRGGDTLELYSTTIKQLQGPQLRSSRLLSPHRSMPPPFIRLSRGTPQPHVRAHNPLWIPSHTSELPLHAKQLGSSWNTTSRWNDNEDRNQWDELWRWGQAEEFRYVSTFN